MKMYHVYAVSYSSQTIISEDYTDIHDAQSRAFEFYQRGYDDWGYYEYEKPQAK